MHNFSSPKFKTSFNTHNVLIYNVQVINNARLAQLTFYRIKIMYNMLTLGTLAVYRESSYRIKLFGTLIR